MCRIILEAEGNAGVNAGLSKKPVSAASPLGLDAQVASLRSSQTQYFPLLVLS